MTTPKLPSVKMSILKARHQVTHAEKWRTKMRLLLTFTAADYIISLFVKEEIKS